MMNRSTLDSIVPGRKRGRNSQVQINANCYSPQAASKLYMFLKVSLTDVNHWTDFKPGINYYPKLVNEHGQILKRNAQAGDLIKILVPGLHGAFRRYDWRKITKIEERMSGNAEIFFLTIIPAVDPELEEPEASHFLKSESSVTFFIIRDEHRVQLEVHTRNEAVNLQLSRFKTTLKNAILGVFMTGGLYQTHWTKLIKSILKYGMARMEITN